MNVALEKGLVREYGRALRGKRIEDTRRGRVFHRVNVVGGLFDGKVIAPLCYEHSIYGVFFEGWFETVFLPCVPRGVAVILDRASFYRKKRLAAIVERAGCLCCFYRLIRRILTVLRIGGLI
jgi:hypothetical protein